MPQIPKYPTSGIPSNHWSISPQSATLDIASPNEASTTDENDIELNEQNLTDLPAGVKFAVEGGDTHVPPGYEDKK